MFDCFEWLDRMYHFNTASTFPKIVPITFGAAEHNLRATKLTKLEWIYFTASIVQLSQSLQML